VLRFYKRDIAEGRAAEATAGPGVRGMTVADIEDPETITTDQSAYVAAQRTSADSALRTPNTVGIVARRDTSCGRRSVPEIKAVNVRHREAEDDLTREEEGKDTEEDNVCITPKKSLPVSHQGLIVIMMIDMMMNTMM
jgi:hypothetical protein